MLTTWFRSGRSCLTNVLEFLDKATRSVDAGDRPNINIIYLDFAKAFDKMSHYRLIKQESRAVARKSRLFALNSVFCAGMFGALKPGFRSLANLKLLVNVVGELQTEKNCCGIARFPCDSTAFLFY